MKVALLILLSLAILNVSAYHKLTQQFRDSQDVFSYVTNGEHQIYILFIYNGQWAAEEMHHPMKARYDLEKKDLLKLIEHKGREIHFSEINVNTGDFTQMLQEMGVNSCDLQDYPVTVVVDNGHGVWVNGPREYHVIAKIIEEFESDPDSWAY